MNQCMYDADGVFRIIFVCVVSTALYVAGLYTIKIDLYKYTFSLKTTEYL